MINMMKKILLAAGLVVSITLPVQANEQLLDRVAAIVNGGVVLESEVEDLLANIKRQAKKK
jgi:peptidyl-prolyl cis-trans isomerase SurA